MGGGIPSHAGTVLPRYDLVQFVQEITDNIRIGVLIYGNGGVV